MEGLIAWCGFVGAWLLFAGPVYQAALELREYDETQEAMTEASRSVPLPEHRSPLWWLIPPVGYILQRRAAGEYRQAVSAALSPDDRELIIEFSNKAAGWLDAKFKTVAQEATAGMLAELRQETAKAEAASRMAVRAAWTAGVIGAVALSAIAGFGIAGL